MHGSTGIQWQIFSFKGLTVCHLEHCPCCFYVFVAKCLTGPLQYPGLPRTLKFPPSIHPAFKPPRAQLGKLKQGSYSLFPNPCNHLWEPRLLNSKCSPLIILFSLKHEVNRAHTWCSLGRGQSGVPGERAFQYPGRQMHHGEPSARFLSQMNHELAFWNTPWLRVTHSLRNLDDLELYHLT